MKQPLVLIAGGSGGHMFPAVAVAQQAQDDAQPCVLLTDQRGLRFLSPQDRDLFFSIVVFPPLKVSNAPSFLFKALAHLRRLKPSVALGFGGKMSFIPLLVARLLHIRCGLHQSDTILGQANRWMLRWMHASFSAHDHRPYATHVIGTPVRKVYGTIRPLEANTMGEKLHLLVLGGSQGAQFWSKLLPETFGLLPESVQKKIHVTHQCRAEEVDALKEKYAALGLAGSDIFSFCFAVHEKIDRAHIVFSRAGASTLAELMVAGRGALLVPYPYAKNNHQKHNADFIVKGEGGWSYDQEALSPQVLAEFLVARLHNHEELLYAGKKMKEMSSPNAANVLYKFFFTS